MNDMKQETEQIIHVNPAQAEELIRSLQARIAELESSLTDWLAERDPTPLTIKVLERMIATNEQDAKEWLIEWHESMSILNHKLTVGELRTLARLAGVQLK